jgi:hypothetical protein
MLIGTVSIVNPNLHTIAIASNSCKEQQQLNMTFIICK